jgi:hypothetical protein
MLIDKCSFFHCDTASKFYKQYVAHLNNPVISFAVNPSHILLDRSALIFNFQGPLNCVPEKS